MIDYATPRERLDSLYDACLVMHAIPTHPGRRTYLEARAYLMRRAIWRAMPDCQHTYTDSLGVQRETKR